MRFIALLLALPAVASAQYTQQCLEDTDSGNGLSLAVSSQGSIHISRVYRVVRGDLVHTEIDWAGNVTDTEVGNRVHRLAIDEVNDTDLILQDDEPRICFYDGRNQRFAVALREGAEWSTETIAEGMRAGDWCAMALVDGALVTAFHHENSLHYAVRNGPDDWAVEEARALANRDVGLEIDMVHLGGGVVAVAYRDTEGAPYISWRNPNGDWVHRAINGLEFRAGASPRITSDGRGGVWLLHGFLPDGSGADGGLLLTSGSPDGLGTEVVVAEAAGGSTGAARIDGVLVTATRDLLRSALFPPQDGLRLYGGLPASREFDYLEVHNAAQQRHTYQSVDLAADPFRLPVVIAQDERSPFHDDPGSGLVCIWRPADRDGDGVPDRAEQRFGSDPDDADSDDDGRSDGEEVLIDHTNPTGQGDLPDAAPEPDVGVLDFGVEPDAAEEEDASPEQDAGEEDDAAEEEDASPEEDAGEEDAAAAEEDAGAEDDATVDAALELDAAAPDPDAATPEADAEVEDAEVEEDFPDVRFDWATEEEEGGGGSSGCTSTPGRSGGAWILLLLVGLVRRR